jgi:flavin reductase (DIM6/NTAB) family NADH-FMN oxidoreductase RutF
MTPSQRRARGQRRPALGRDEFGRFIDGVEFPMYVVTAASPDERSGCLLAFATRVAVDPPRYLVSISEKNRTCEVAQGAQFLAVHLLGKDQHDLAELFGGETGEDVDKFDHWPWDPGPGGVPILGRCPRVMVGQVLERFTFEDHVGHLLRPVEVYVRGGVPGLVLTDVEDIDPGHPA